MSSSPHGTDGHGTPDGDSRISRRGFLKTTLGAGIAGAIALLLPPLPGIGGLGRRTASASSCSGCGGGGCSFWGSWQCGNVTPQCAPCPKANKDSFRQRFDYWPSWNETEQSCDCPAYCGGSIEWVCNACGSGC